MHTALEVLQVQRVLVVQRLLVRLVYHASLHLRLEPLSLQCYLQLQHLPAHAALRTASTAAPTCGKLLRSPHG
jgi:hypothetical protein